MKFEKTDIGRLYADNVKRSGHTQEGSEIILNNCLDLLEDKGLIGIILPEGILSHEESFARNLREKIYSNFQVLEQWSLPKKFFDAEHIAKVLILRKVKPTSFKI